MPGKFPSTRKLNYLSEHFGNNIGAVFTDEPTLPHPFPINERMIKIYEKEYGESVIPYLPMVPVFLKHGNAVDTSGTCECITPLFEGEEKHSCFVHKKFTNKTIYRPHFLIKYASIVLPK